MLKLLIQKKREDMTDKRYIQISILLAVVICGSLAQARLGDVMDGRSHAIETRTVKTSQLGEVIGQRKKTATKNPTRSVCPTLPTTIPTVVPTQNPNAPAVAFYVNPATGQTAPTANSTNPPPQTIGALTTVSQVSPGFGQPFNFNGPFNASMCAGLEQVLLASTWQMISFNRDLSMDNMLNTDLLSFANQDGDFSFWLTGSEEIEMRYDKFANRFYFAMDAFSYLGSVDNTGVCFGVSDSGVISEDTTWTIVTIANACLIPDSNGCPGDITPDAVLYDYCSAGLDQNAYYFTFNIFDNTSGPYISTSVFVIQKQSLFNGGPVVVTAFRDIVGYPGEEEPYRDASSTLIPAMNFDSDPEFGYFIGQDPLLFGKLIVYRVINPGSANPTLSAVSSIDVPTTYTITSPTTLAPFAGNQYGILGVIGALDDR